MFNIEEYLAPYACFSSKSRGRLYPEPNSSSRSEFQRDRDRILHSTAFRRLEYKTQVFIYNEGDHYRTRLTHSLEVSQIARSIARILSLDEDLSEAVAICHDMGHSPFGHAGEDALQECMSEYEGFDHNAQTVRILTSLEKKYAKFDGLNLSWECLEGAAKHNGPVKNPTRALVEYNEKHNLELNSYASLEAQVAAISDDIAYNSHDIEDGIRAELFSIEDLLNVPIISEEILKLKNEFPSIADDVLMNEARSGLIKHLLRDVISESRKNIKALDIKSVADVRNANQQIVNFSKTVDEKVNQIRQFLYQNMYKHPKVISATDEAQKVVRDLFHLYIKNPEKMTNSWAKAQFNNEKEKAIIVADFIAGMTDRYAFKQHKKLFNSSN